MSKKKLTYLQRRKQEEKVNYKAIYWTSGIAIGIIILMSILLILDS